MPKRAEVLLPPRLSGSKPAGKGSKVLGPFLLLREAIEGSTLRLDFDNAIGANVPLGVTLKGGANQTKLQLRRLVPVATPTQRRGFESQQDDPGTVLDWYDFLCPFCYVGQNRTAILLRHGFRLTLTFHPAEFLRALAMGRCMPCWNARPEKLDCH
jgi:hypothetical protein